MKNYTIEELIRIGIEGFLTQPEDTNDLEFRKKVKRNYYNKLLSKKSHLKKTKQRTDIFEPIIAKLQVSENQIDPSDFLSEILYKAVSKLVNFRQFKKELRNNPRLIFEDPITQFALSLLRLMCFKPDSRIYREMLDQLGLRAFMPTTPTRQKSSSFLQDWADYPDLLIDLVSNYQDKIRPFLEEHDKTLSKGKRIAKAFEDIFCEPMPKNITFGEKDKSLETIALVFISHEFEVKFYALRKLYYDSKSSA